MLKVTVSLNGVRVKKDVATSWPEVDFETSLLLADVAPNRSKALAILCKIDYEIFSRAEVTNLDSVLSYLTFLDFGVEHKLPKTILGYPLPENLDWVTTGRYEDCLSVIESFPKEEKNVKTTDIKKFTEICACFCMPDYHDADEKKRQLFADQFLKAPCTEVLAIGNFIAMKLLNMKVNGGKSSRPTLTLARRCRLVLISWLKRWAFTVRYSSWKRKLRITEMNLNAGK